MDSNLPQSSNMDTPIEGTPTGILIVVSFIHPLKALSPILCISSEIVIESSSEQPEKAPSVIPDTLYSEPLYVMIVGMTMSPAYFSHVSAR